MLIIVVHFMTLTNLEAIHLLENSVLDDCGYVENAYQY